ncbi:MAG: galactosyldiacylglycerol synthase [Myxococcales bacterium]|nr:galactosyldiacylglycerol synthase [Myxococcales bacterium]
MPRLYRVDNNETIGQITDKQLQFLVDMLEEEDQDDQDYYINQDTLELFSDNNCDPELLALLEGALEDGEDGIDVAWE